MMKNLNAGKILRAGILGLSLTVAAALPVAAQNTNGNANGRAVERTERSETPRPVAVDNDTDWGWLGLLGLLGLAGLIPKKRRVEVQEFRDTNRPATGTGTPQ